MVGKLQLVSADPEGGSVALANSAGGGDSGGMDQIAVLASRADGLDKRMDRFETQLDKVEERLGRVEVQLGEIKATVDLLANRIIGRLPTWWQMPTVIVATSVLLVGLAALAKHFHLLG